MDSWGKAAESALRVLEALPFWGVLIVSGVVGLGIVVVLVGHFGGLFQGQRTDQRGIGMIDRLMKQVEDFSAREGALRADLERQEREADTYRLRAVELQADVELMRIQLRRLIETARAVREGRLQPSEIKDADLAEVLR